jgi:hypothetical protein
MNKVFRKGFWLLGLLSAHCGIGNLSGGSGAGNPPLAEVALAFKANSAADGALPKSSSLASINPDGTLNVKDSAGALFTLTAIEVLARQIDFDLPEGLSCENASGVACDSDEVNVDGPFRIELVAGTAVPALNTLKPPEGLYTMVSLDLEENKTDSAKADSSSASSGPYLPNLVILGKTDSAKGPVRRFALKLSLTEGLDFLDPKGIRISSKALNSVLLKLAVDGWFQGVDLTSCLDSGEPFIDSLGLHNLYGDHFCLEAGSRIRKNIEASGDLDVEEEDGNP